ncbi:MAG: TlpA family protein disulfide reductase [Bacteroidota bacterium]|nr:TlpA family protein disulfide reductase [Bacteroidota bacterium]
MRTLLLIPLLICSFLSAAQDIKVLKLADLEKRIRNTSDTTYIVNFWATWCVPCVKELPDFDSIHKSFGDKKVKVLLVSLDFKEDIQSKLIPFIQSKKIVSQIVLLDEVNGNYFIPKISTLWSGAIPATLILNNAKKADHFFEKKLDYQFLKNEIELIQQSETK